MVYPVSQGIGGIKWQMALRAGEGEENEKLDAYMNA